MAKTLAASIATATGQRITTPGYLVQIDFSTPLRLSSRGDQSWNDYTWTRGRLGKVDAGEGGGSIELLNADLAMSALVLNEGLADRAVTVWAFYADNPTDVEQVFAGVADSTEIGSERVRTRLLPENRATQYSPRRFINAAAGFNTLMPAGTRITWGGQTFVLERR